MGARRCAMAACPFPSICCSRCQKTCFESDSEVSKTTLDAGLVWCVNMLCKNGSSSNTLVCSDHMQAMVSDSCAVAFKPVCAGQELAATVSVCFRVSYQDVDVAACETQPAHDRQRRLRVDREVWRMCCDPQLLEGDEESRFV